MIKTTILLLITTSLAIAEPLIRPGDHVAIVGNTFADQLRRYGYFETLLVQRCPGIAVRNLGWAGDTVFQRDRPTNFPTEDSTLTTHQADVILLCFGMGESLSGQNGIQAFHDALLERIKHYKSQKYNGLTPPRLILVSPIRGQDLGRVTPRFSEQVNDRSSYAMTMKKIAADEKIGYMDLFSPVTPKGRMTSNGMHLTDVGYRWISRHMMAALFDDGHSKPWQPSGFASDWMVAKDLDPGYYAMYLDDQRVTTATHEDWTEGVELKLPINPEVEKLRKAIIEKNAQWVFGWKALNQVHIVGERKKSNSGRALPEEVQEFLKLTVQQESALQELIPNLQTRMTKLLADPERKIP